jgi:hypothetical protein
MENYAEQSKQSIQASQAFQSKTGEGISPSMMNFHSYGKRSFLLDGATPSKLDW